MSQSNSRYDTTFINTSGGILTEQLVRKLREQQCSEEAVNPASFIIQDDGPTTQTAFETEVSEVWESLKERWDSLSQDNEIFSLDTSEIRQRWSIPLLEQLGFDPDYQQSNLEASGIEANLSHLGWSPQESVQAADSPFEDRPPVLHMTQPDGNHRLDDGDHAGTGVRGKSPHDELQTYLNANSDVQWSVVTDGLKLRVLREFYHTYTRGYVEFDLENIFTNRNFNDFRALYRLCHASRFTSEGADDEQPVESLYQVSIATGVKIGEDLQSNVVEALETLANGFLTPEIREQLNEGGQDVAGAYYQDQLRIVYRLLFLLFAEQRGMMADRGDIYTDEYSVSALRERAERNSVNDSATDLWEGLQVTFELIGEGRDDEHLQVPGYNGGLFNDGNLSFVDTATCPNHALLNAVHNLTHIEQEGYQQRISYADLGVDEIGAVYESLLEFTPQYATEIPEIEDRDISRGQFYLDSRGMERKETGSYYTKPELVDELIDSALKPVVEDRVGSVESAESKELALLDIDVCDPACGSGAFLIAANNFLGKRLAEIRTESAYPDEKELRQARRSVVQHCLYGVDLNPMAVELARVSLWINSAVEDKPLSFLDHRVKQGNSLVGTTPGLISQGVPVDAYETSSGRDWHIGNEIRKRVRKENSQIQDDDRQVRLERQWDQSESDYVSLAEKLDYLEETKIEDIYEKEQIYSDLRDSVSFQREKLAHDVWTAAFYWPLDGSAEKYPTPNTIGQIRRDFSKLSDEQVPDSSGLDSLIEIARNISVEESFFHWPLEFPAVYNDGGFDCLLGNPPWERIEIEENQFFATRASHIANISTTAERKKAINDLEETNPDLLHEYEKSVKRANQQVKFFRESGRFPLTGRGNVNTYAVFAELATDEINNRGHAGIIVPTGIATNSRTQYYFREIVETRRLKSLSDFTNRKGLFSDVDGRFKFSLMTLTGSKIPNQSFDLAFSALDVEQLYRDDLRYSLTRSDIESINPNTKTCPTFTTKADADLVLKIYQDTGVFVNESEDVGNSWNIRWGSVFNTSHDSNYFYTKSELKENGWELNNNFFKKQDDTMIPLYESKLFHQYNHRFATFADVGDNEVEKGKARKMTSEELNSSKESVIPRYWVPKEAYQEKNGSNWHLALRSITNATNRRTVIASILPGVATSDSLNLISGLPATDSLLLLCAFNSYVLDYVCRQKLSGTNLNNYIINQLPIPSPNEFRRVKIDGTKVADVLSQNAAKLMHTAKDLDEYATEASVKESYRFEPETNQREDARFKIEAIMCYLYGMDTSDFEQLFSTFEQIQEKDENKYGYYRTRDEIKKRFTEIAPQIADTAENKQ